MPPDAAFEYRTNDIQRSDLSGHRALLPRFVGD